MQKKNKKSGLGKKFAKAAGVVILSAAALAISIPHLSGVFNKSAKAVNPENKIELVEEVTQQKTPQAEVLEQKVVAEQKHGNERTEALELYRDFLGFLIEASHKGDIGLSDNAMEDIEKFHKKLFELDLNNLTVKQLNSIDTITDSFQSTSYYGKIPLPETLLAEKEAKVAEKQAKLSETPSGRTGRMMQKVTSYTTDGGNITSYQSDTVSGDIDSNGNVTNVKKTSISSPSNK